MPFKSTSEVIYPTSFSITRPLSEIIAENPYVEPDYNGEVWVSSDRKNRPHQTFLYSAADGAQYGNDPSIVQTKMGTRTNPAKAIIQNWAGVTSSSYPPDPSGAVGPSHYIQATNATTVRIFNKTGITQSTFDMGDLFDGTNNGDPIVMYDKFADRWFLAQFGSTSSKKIYIAISQTSDPLGSYYTWTYTSPQFPDYLKFSIWGDGYYMTSNQSTDKVYVFERSVMLTGGSGARGISSTFSTGSVSAFFVPLPADAADADALPSAGTPLPFFAYYDNGWGGGTDGVKIWSMTTNWTTGTATISAATQTNTNSFDAAYDTYWDDVPQPNGVYLDGIGGVLMYRAPWRSWTGYNSVVLSWGVLIDDSPRQRAIYWCELRQTAGTWSVYQQGVYAPDTDTRWMSSAAMDDNGSIALCYCKSSASAGDYPGLYYTGRLASDPLGTMSFAETTAIAGTGSQSSYNRFGDYSHTSLDPDGITFWHTGQYSASSAGQETRVYSFQLPISAAATISSNPTNVTACSGAAANFSVTATGNATINYRWQKNAVDISGAISSTYSIPAVVAGDAGSYRCIVSNATGSDTSTVATLTVNATTVINTQPVGLSAFAGDNVSLTVVAAGTSISYQWKKDGSNVNNGGNITGATTATLQISSITTANFGTYTCLVTGTCGNVTSDDAVVTVIDAIDGTESKKPEVYPNPSTGMFSITFGANVNTGSYSVYDLDGKLLMWHSIQNEQSVEIDMKGRAQGTYLIRLDLDSKTYFDRLILKN